MDIATHQATHRPISSSTQTTNIFPALIGRPDDYTRITPCCRLLASIDHRGGLIESSTFQLLIQFLNILLTKLPFKYMPAIYDLKLRDPHLDIRR